MNREDVWSTRRWLGSSYDAPTALCNCNKERGRQKNSLIVVLRALQNQSGERFERERHWAATTADKRCGE